MPPEQLEPSSGYAPTAVVAEIVDPSLSAVQVTPETVTPLTDDVPANTGALVPYVCAPATETVTGAGLTVSVPGTKTK